MLKPSLNTKLQHISERYSEIAALLSTQEVMDDQNRYRDLAMEYAALEPVVQTYQEHLQTIEAVEQAQDMLENETDAELKELAQEDLKSSQTVLESLKEKLYLHLIPKDPNDEANVFIEVRAGTGGDEAALFAGDLFRMYSRYAENKNWQIEMISASESEQGGYKEVVARIIGHGAFSELKFESGAHRVQRVPVTESSGRIHTSACTVAILPEVAQVESINIDTKDLRIDTFRASGAGGQHVNKTDSAIRITHLPTGTVVECQDERSQHKNKARALSLLSARLLDAEQSKQQAQEAQNRRLQVGSGDRSERIRTYNFPQSRVTDHRINLTLYQLDELMAGKLDIVVQPLMREHQMDLLAELNSDG